MKTSISFHRWLLSWIFPRTAVFEVQFRAGVSMNVRKKFCGSFERDMMESCIRTDVESKFKKAPIDTITLVRIDN